MRMCPAQRAKLFPHVLVFIPVSARWRALFRTSNYFAWLPTNCLNPVPNSYRGLLSLSAPTPVAQWVRPPSSYWCQCVCIDLWLLKTQACVPTPGWMTSWGLPDLAQGAESWWPLPCGRQSCVRVRCRKALWSVPQPIVQIHRYHGLQWHKDGIPCLTSCVGLATHKLLWIVFFSLFLLFAFNRKPLSFSRII